MKIIQKLIVVFAVIILVAVGAWLFVFKSEETGPATAEAVSEDGLLKLTVMLEKTRFTTDPREPVKINLTLTNIGNQELTLTFHYKSKFDFMIWDYTQAAYAYRWSYDHIQGPADWAANVSTYPIHISLEQPDISTVTLSPGEGISHSFLWNQYYSGGGGEGWTPQVELAPKGRYRIEGIAGFGRWSRVADNPLRYFEYTLPDGVLISAVIQTPGIDIVLA